MGDEFIGSGWAFPLRTNAAGGIALVSGRRELEESMRLILATAPGERPMRPEFGCGIHDLVFAGADDETTERIIVEVQQALGRWEPRVTVEEVLVTPDESNPARLVIDIHYAPVSTNDPRNLVFPFYTIPGEPDE